MRLTSVFFLTLALAALSPLSAAAESAEGFVRARHTELRDLVSRGKKADPELSKIFDTMIDYDDLAENALNRHWGERTDEEKAAFRCVLKHLVQNAYRKNLSKTAKYEVVYEGETAAERGQLVKTVARSKNGKSREEPVSIDYVVVEKDGAMVVVDIVTEGSSLVGNFRSQFNKIIKKKGFDGLMKRMKDKLAKSGTKADC